MSNATVIHSSRRRTTRARRSSLALLWNSQAHDISNLCWEQEAHFLYPTIETLLQLPDFDDQYILQLWKQTEPSSRRSSSAAMPASASAAISINVAQDYGRQLRQPQHNAIPPSAPSTSVSVQPHIQTTPQPTRSTPARNHETPAANNRSSGIPRQPRPRPKLDYKRIYSRDDHPNSPRRSIVSGSSRHISFQEQQLQRTLEEEGIMQQSINETVEEVAIPESFSVPAPLEPSYPMPCPIELSYSRPPPVPPSYPMPCPIDLSPQVQLSSSPVVNHEKVSLKTTKKDDKQTVKASEKDCHPSHPRTTSPPPFAHPAAGGNGRCTTVMEISPNVFVPYRGSHETWSAIQSGHVLVTTCFACSLQLVIIDCAEYLVCPDCHTVSPLYFSDCSRRIERSGVGLGIKREWCDVDAALDGVVGEQPAESGYQTPSLQAYPATNKYQ